MDRGGGHFLDKGLQGDGSTVCTKPSSRWRSKRKTSGKTDNVPGFSFPNHARGAEQAAHETAAEKRYTETFDGWVNSEERNRGETPGEQREQIMEREMETGDLGEKGNRLKAASASAACPIPGGRRGGPRIGGRGVRRKKASHSKGKPMERALCWGPKIIREKTSSWGGTHMGGDKGQRGPTPPGRIVHPDCHRRLPPR